MSSGGEFAIISRYFSRPAPSAILGGGDDCALIAHAAGEVLAVTTDSLVEGRHFAFGAEARGVGYKSLAVNISDLAAMGARPRWAVLALTLPAVEPNWLDGFASGFYACASEFSVDLIGGNLSAGALNITVTALGTVPAHEAMRRDAAHVGDDIWISGQPGAAALALTERRGELQLPERWRAVCAERLDRPYPRVALGLRLRALAHAAIDVSDGVLADLGHLLTRSGVGALLDEQGLSCWAASWCEAPEILRRCVLSGGDDYELLFTAAPDRRDAITALGAELATPLCRCGVITAAPGVSLSGGAYSLRPGHDHFAA